MTINEAKWQQELLSWDTEWFGSINFNDLCKALFHTNYGTAVSARAIRMQREGKPLVMKATIHWQEREESTGADPGAIAKVANDALAAGIDGLDVAAAIFRSKLKSIVLHFDDEE